MPKKTTTKKAGYKPDKVTAKLLKEQAQTDLENAKRHEEMVAEEAAKVKATAEAAANQAPLVTPPVQLPNKEREAAWKKHLAEYKKLNPVKYAAKEKAGQFKEIPASFTGTNQMVV